MDPGGLEPEGGDRLPPGGVAHGDDARTRSDGRGEQRSVQAPGTACRSETHGPAPHLDVVDRHDLARRGESQHRLAAEPVHQVRVHGDRVPEHLWLGAEEPRRTCLAPGS